MLNEVGLVEKYIIKIRIFKNRLSITAIIVPVVIYRNYYDISIFVWFVGLCHAFCLYIKEKLCFLCRCGQNCGNWSMWLTLRIGMILLKDTDSQELVKVKKIHEPEWLSVLFQSLKTYCNHWNT